MKHVHSYVSFMRKKFNRYTCRCLHCDARRTFETHPDRCSRRRRCRFCNHSKWRVDWYRMVREKRDWNKSCRCPAAHYPHRATWCAKLTGD